MANIEHQAVVAGLTRAIMNAFAADPRVNVYPGVNVSDRRDAWEQNYRCPDVAVVLPNSKAQDCGPFFWGGPDFVVEVVSDYDRSREKFEFYSGVQVRELLIVDRNPWQLELFRLKGKQLLSVGMSELQAGAVLSSEVLPLTFRLLASTTGRPRVEICKSSTSERWLA
jgi:Uma2 family endonuclease